MATLLMTRFTITAQWHQTSRNSYCNTIWCSLCSLATPCKCLPLIHECRPSNSRRGAKVAMTVALRSPKHIGAIIPVDNAPVDAVLKSDFAKYVRGMKKIVDSRATKQTEADEILKLYEEVWRAFDPAAQWLTKANFLYRLLQFDSSCLQIWSATSTMGL